MNKHLLRPIMKRLFVVYGLLTRAMTLGVRVVVVDEKQHLLLVRHTYVDGWHLPGGGVERGETLAAAAIKEVWEEANVKVHQTPRFFHAYRNPIASRFDHVALMICEEWENVEGWKANHEIAEIGFFAIDDLPEATTRATRQRIEEVFNAQPPSHDW